MQTGRERLFYGLVENLRHRKLPWQRISFFTVLSAMAILKVARQTASSEIQPSVIYKAVIATAYQTPKPFHTPSQGQFSLIH